MFGAVEALSSPIVGHSDIARTIERDHVQSTGTSTMSYRYEKGRQLNGLVVLPAVSQLRGGGRETSGYSEHTFLLLDGMLVVTKSIFISFARERYPQECNISFQCALNCGLTRIPYSGYISRV